ncbi:hypothetical protein BXU06_05790 [Aquaspirillum sp. LM1]|nr:hypothetical protein BXU06_05790 [Aquaspirillum sp. LM1]
MDIQDIASTLTYEQEWGTSQHKQLAARVGVDWAAASALHRNVLGTVGALAMRLGLGGKMGDFLWRSGVGFVYFVCFV